MYCSDQQIHLMRFFSLFLMRKPDMVV